MKKQNPIKKFNRKMAKKWNSLHPIWQKSILIFCGLLILGLIFNLAIESYFGFIQGKVIDRQSCIDAGVQVALEHSAHNWWQIILIENAKVIIIFLGISWLLHGVQLRLFA